jgi:ribosome maturation factor RimP
MNVRQTLENITADILSQFDGIFVVEINQKHDNYEFVLDGDKPMGIYDISYFAREINRQADEQMPEAQYSLDVTSPGADSPLKLLRQYANHVGRNFQLSLADDSALKGKLIAVEGEKLTFEYYKNEKPKKNEAPEKVEIEFKQIKQANIILSFK